MTTRMRPVEQAQADRVRYPEGTKVWLIALTGQGDTELKLVGEPTYKWITEKDTSVPSYQIDLHLHEEAEAAEQGKCRARAPETIIKDLNAWKGSSPDNDRALAAMPEYGDQTFYSIRDLARYVIITKMDIAGEFDGEIY